MNYSGTNFNFSKNVLGQTFKFQAKKKLSFPCIPIFKKFITIKKNHRNKKNFYSLVYPFLKIYNHKKEPQKYKDTHLP